jgi:hypothetical protein
VYVLDVTFKRNRLLHVVVFVVVSAAAAPEFVSSDRETVYKVYDVRVSASWFLYKTTLLFFRLTDSFLSYIKILKIHQFFL